MREDVSHFEAMTEKWPLHREEHFGTPRTSSLEL